MTEDPFDPLPNQPPEGRPFEDSSTPQQQPAQPPMVRIQIPERTPYVTYAILGLTIFVFIIQMLTQNYQFGVDLPSLYGMKINELIQAGEYWRLFTPMLLHANIIHIGFNMYALSIIGRELERQFGHGRFLLLYVISGFAGNVISFAFTPAPSLGASTAIFGIFGAQGIFIYQNRELFGARASAALRQIVQLAVINLVIGLSPGIDNWGHIGGLIGGMGFTWIAGPLLGLEGISPNFSIIDKRDSGDIFRATVVVGGLFLLIAAGFIILRSV